MKIFINSIEIKDIEECHFKIYFCIFWKESKLLFFYGYVHFKSPLFSSFFLIRFSTSVMTDLQFFEDQLWSNLMSLRRALSLVRSYQQREI